MSRLDPSPTVYFLQACGILRPLCSSKEFAELVPPVFPSSCLVVALPQSKSTRLPCVLLFTVSKDRCPDTVTNTPSSLLCLSVHSKVVWPVNKGFAIGLNHLVRLSRLVATLS